MRAKPSSAALSLSSPPPSALNATVNGTKLLSPVTVRYQSLGGWDWFFLAMVRQRLGQDDEARRCFDSGVQWLEERQAADPEAQKLWGWTERVETHCLRREAESMIDGAKPPHSRKEDP